MDFDGLSFCLECCSQGPGGALRFYCILECIILGHGFCFGMLVVAPLRAGSLVVFVSFVWVRGRENFHLTKLKC